jgi:transcriptional regulator with XRE-family HTH domain
MTTTEINALKKRIGKNLKRIREAKGLSLRELSYECSIGHARISEIESGKLNIRVSTLAELAEALGIEPGELLK